jgi:NCAIR mutase (PurE)-related protein
MRKHLKLASAALVIALPGFAQALSWGQHTTIQGYYSDTNANIVLTTANNQNPDSCASSQYLVISAGTSNFNQVYAALMTAQATGSTVTLLYNGCLGGYPLISSVAVPANW